MQIIRRKNIGENEPRAMNKNRNCYSVSVNVIPMDADVTQFVERLTEFFNVRKQIVLILLARNLVLQAPATQPASVATFNEYSSLTIRE